MIRKKIGSAYNAAVPRVFVTDGLQAYRDAFKKEYGAVKKGSPIHIRHISLKGDRNNNKMERD
jgi:transposase-like protein